MLPSLSTLSVNCRSLSKNFDKLEYTMKSLNFNFDCIGLTETWLKANEETNIYNIWDVPYYQRQDRVKEVEE